MMSEKTGTFRHGNAIRKLDSAGKEGEQCRRSGRRGQGGFPGKGAAAQTGQVLAQAKNVQEDSVLAVAVPLAVVENREDGLLAAQRGAIKEL
jgi:hypothetical protein